MYAISQVHFDKEADREDILRFLCDQFFDHSDLSRSLVTVFEDHFSSLLGNRGHSHSNIDTTVDLLAIRGADLDFDDRPLTALQLAVANADLKNTSRLLDLGAEPKRIGNSKSPPYATAPLSRLNRFRGQSPLRICQVLIQEQRDDLESEVNGVNGVNGVGGNDGHDEDDEDDVLEEISQNLIQAGGEDSIED
ncbi:hypothetical protein G7Z17_g13436 [Cylindrodendrum hubeiense]|uniref:Ankyrin repeat protein n=1 Tax=Cylindrodendrum hubeiense TaxID=595255 RepID=A0A9P5GVV1_9HYPO|nr:hypothetical protein G7Z17_g13436 [Cylindrodendrum hubeiense]